MGKGSLTCAKTRKRKSLILAISRKGVVAYEIQDGSYNGSKYANFISKLPQGSTVLADNASIHKTRWVKNIASEQNMTLKYTPPYCPWLNPVENAFAIVKHRFRKARAKCMSSDHTNDIEDSLTRVTGEKCSAFFDHAEHCLDMEHKEGKQDE